MKKSSLIKTGIIFILCIALLIWGFNFLQGKNILKTKTVFYGVYDKVNGLTSSSPVLLNGFTIGQVEQISFTDNVSAKLLIKISVDKKYKIPKNSTAEIYSLDLMGSMGIRINRPVDFSEFHSDGDTLITKIEGDFKEQVNLQILPLKRKAEDLISSFDTVLIVIRGILDQQTRQNLSRSFASIKTTLANLEKTTFTLDTLVSSEKSKLMNIFSNIESISNNLKNSNDLISNTLKNLSSVTDSLAKADISKTINQANAALLQVNEIIDKINHGDGTLALLLRNDTLYNNLDNSAYHLNRLLRDLHENPKRYLHFSLIDIGRTTYKIDKDDDSRKKNNKKPKQ